MLAAGDQPGDVRHVDEKNAPTESAICRRRGKSNDARISRSAGGDHRRPHFLGLFLQRVVIDLLRLLVHAVMRDLDKICRKNLPDAHG